MTTAKTQTLLAQSEPIDDEYARLLEVISNRLQAGQSPNIEQYCRDYPRYAKDLQQLIPAMEMLGALAGPAVDENGSHHESAATSLHCQPLGDFQIIREIGRGGMGIVYEAEQLSLGRRVALKVLPFAAVLDKRHLARFENEARAAATLEHPHIVPVYAVGEQRGVHYYAMRLIRGQSLAEAIEQLRNAECGVRSESEVRNAECGVRSDEDASSHSEVRIPNSELETRPIAALATERSSNPRAYFRRVAEIGGQIADALQHAHERGILHRDVKPANILLGDEGKAWITDFGLARFDGGASMTASGDLLGTLRYMSPEQIAGKGAVVDHRTDVYSLGITLYELATRQPAFAGDDRQTIARRIETADPQPPRKIDGRIPADLETIINKAIEKDPEDRYATAGELADDVRRFVHNLPIRARRASPLSRVHKWARRHIAAVLGVSALLLISLTVLGVAFALVSIEQKAKITAQNAQNAEQQGKIAALNERNTALEEAQANLEVATAAVDDLYTNFAVEWIAKETAPSNLQQQFLHKAADFYRRIVERPAKTPRGRLTQANAYYRIGDLELYLENFEEAVGPLEKSVELTRRLRQEFPTDAAYHEAMADRSLDLGHAYRELQDFNRAQATLQEVLSLLERLPDGKTKSDRLVTCKLEQADIMQRQGKLDEALRLMVELRDQLLKANPTGTYYPLSLIDCRYRIASILLDQDQLSEAVKTHEEAHSQCRGMRGLMYEDSRSLLRGEMDLLVQCGDIAARQGELENAIAHYRESLELQRQSFKEQRTPEQFNNAKYAGEVSSEPEPGPFARYVETQLRLADVLRRAGRPYDAETELGSCEYVTRVLADIARPKVLRYRILQANVWAMAANLAAVQERPDEARGPRRIAARIWLDALEQFPHAADYQSGVHGRHSDLEWFRKSFPGELAENAATPDEADNFRDTPFGRRATAATAFRREDWQTAAKEFAQSAQLRTNDQAYDWLHAAIARAHLGHAMQAKNFFDAASAEMSAVESVPPDFFKLYDEARQLIGKLSLPDSYYKFDRVVVGPDTPGLAFAHYMRIGPDGNLYLASHEDDAVTVFDSETGASVRSLTAGDDLDGPWGMTFGPDGGLYVCGHWTRNIVRFDVTTQKYDVFVPSGSGGLELGKGIAFGPNGHLYVASRTDDNVKQYNGKTGEYMGNFVAAESDELKGVSDITFGADGNLYAIRANPNTPRTVDVHDGTTGKFLKTFISGPLAELGNPVLLEFRDDGYLYVASQINCEIKRFDAKTGEFVDLIVPTGVESPKFQGLDAFAFDHQGRLFVSIGTARDPAYRGVFRYLPTKSTK